MFSNDTAGNGNNTARIQTIRLDNTVPRVEASNISFPVNGRNYSDSAGGLLILNVSIVDVTSSIRDVSFNITNSSGAQNASYTASNPTGNYWNATLNTSHFPDGVYNVTVFSNDTAGNGNNTARVYTLKIDNTNPTGSLSCTPNPVTEGEKTTCACTSSDTTTGVKTTTNTENPSTILTGTFTHNCGIEDYTNNSITISTTYTVTGRLAGGGGGSSGSSGGGGAITPVVWKRTLVVNEEQFQTGTTRELKDDERVQVTVSGEYHYVGVASLTSTTVTITVSSTPQQATLSIGEEKKFEVTNDSFYDIYVKLNGIKNNEANLTIKNIREVIPLPSPPTTGEVTQETTQPSEEEPSTEIAQAPPSEVAERSFMLVWILIVLAIVAIIVVIFYKYYMTKKYYHRGY